MARKKAVRPPEDTPKRPNHRPPKVKQITPDNLTGKEWYSIYEVAEMMNLHDHTIRRMIKDGRLNAKKYGAEWRIHPEDLAGFVAPDKSEGVTPSGGAYSEIYYFDDDGNSVSKESASKCVIRECASDGNLIQETFGTVKHTP